MFVATVVWSTKRGQIAGQLVVLGHVMAEIAIISALLLGLRFLLESNEVRLVSGILGGTFLVWSSLDLLKASMSNSKQLQLGLESDSPMSSHPVLAGLTTSVSNPYFFIWWATVGNHYTVRSLEIAGYIGVAVFAFSHWISDLTWFSLVSLSVSRGRRIISDKVYRIILGICGVFLILLGGLFIYNSAKTILATGQA
jgi:threonine/homoserine/homoserine lactone efflux protein